VPTLRITVSQAAAGQTEIATAGTGTAFGTSNDKPPFPLLDFTASDHNQQAVYITAKNFWEEGDSANALAALRKHERDHSEGTLFTPLRRTAEEALGITGTNDEKSQRPAFPGILLSFLGRQTQTAIIRETTVRRIPDLAGEELTLFREGQPVLVTTSTKVAAQQDDDFWYKVTANDDKKTSGWVLESSLIFY
jgi:hypothetical protein